MTSRAGDETANPVQDLSTAEAARLLRVAAGTLRRAVRRGLLVPAYYTPGGHARFRHADLDRWRGQSTASGALTDGGFHALRAPAILETLPEACLVVDRHWRVLHANAAAERMLGRPRADLLDRVLFAVYPPVSTHSPFHDRLQRAMTERVPVTFTEYSPDLGRWLDLHAAPLGDGLIGYFHDVTDRLEADRVTARSEQRLRVLFASAPLGMCITDEDGVFEAVNPALCELLGYSAEALIAQNFAVLLREPERAPALLAMAGAFDQGEEWQAEFEVAGSDGATHAVLATTVAIRVGDDRLKRLSFVLDISDRKRMEEALRASEARLRAVVMSAPIILFATDAHGVVTLALGGLSLTGSDVEDYVGRSIYDIHQANPAALAHFQRALRGEAHSSTHSVNDTHLESRWLPVFGDDGGVTGMIGVSYDVTERVRGETAAQIAREAAEQLARMRSEFVANISHELRTPLTAILGFAEILQRRWALLNDAERQRRLANVVLAARRQQRLVEDLLLLNRVDAGGLTVTAVPTELPPLISQLTDELRIAYHGQSVSLDGPAGVWVCVDPDRAGQILANLMDNAAKYSPHGSTIWVSWHRQDGFIAIRVRDEGKGIAAAGRERLFTRFGRLPNSQMRAGKVGTGIGLYLARMLAHAMGGELDVESTSTAGTVFLLLLPAATSQKP